MKEVNRMNNQFLTAKDISLIINRSEGYAYKLIRQLNKELAEKGYITIAARIPRKYFEKRVFGGEEQGE